MNRLRRRQMKYKYDYDVKDDLKVKESLNHSRKRIRG